MNPAQNIIAKLGGPSNVSGIVGIHRTRVSSWQRPRQKGGTGGLIPQNHHRALLDYAEQNNIRLSAEDFLPPRAPAALDQAGAA